MEDTLYENKFLFSFPRAIYRADGENSVGFGAHFTFICILFKTKKPNKR